MSTVTSLEGRLGVTIGRLLDRLSQGFHAELREQDLTPPLAMTLRLLDEPRSMRFLADAHRCDASNITGLVDRLERRGLVERTPDPTDRRVTLVTRTPEGSRVRKRLATRAFATLDGRRDLSESELEELIALLERLIG